MKGELYKQVGLCLKSFQFAKSEKMFFRNSDNKVDLIGLAIADRGEHLEVEPFLGVRFPKIEDIIQAESGLYGLPNKLSFTVGIRLPGDLILYRDENEAGNIAADIGRRIKESGEPFFGCFQNIGEVDAALNSDPNARCPVDLNAPDRCSHGIIASKLVGRSNHNELIQIYSTQLGRISNGFWLGRFEKLVAYLEANVSKPTVPSVD